MLTPRCVHTNLCSDQDVFTPICAHINLCSHQPVLTTAHVHTNLCSQQSMFTSTCAHTSHSINSYADTDGSNLISVSILAVHRFDPCLKSHFQFCLHVSLQNFYLYDTIVSPTYTPECPHNTSDLTLSLPMSRTPLFASQSYKACDHCSCHSVPSIQLPVGCADFCDAAQRQRIGKVMFLK